MNGIYVANYTGAMGSGSAVLILKDGQIAGADVTGGNYAGQYTINEKTNILNGNINLTVPPSTQLAMGGGAGTVPLSFDIPINLPFDFSNGQVLPLETIYGPLNVIFTRVRDVI